MNQPSYGFATPTDMPYPSGPPPPYEQPWQSAPQPNALYPRLNEQPQQQQHPGAGHVKPAGHSLRYDEGTYQRMPEGPPVPAAAASLQGPHQPTVAQRDVPVPYTSPIPGGLRPGKMIRLRGTPRGSGFAVNLQTGLQGGNVALHLNVRFTPTDRGVMIRNSKINGSWGTEERHGPPPLFRQETPFDIIILAEGSNYKIAVNNQHYVDYIHRVPLDVTDIMSVTGDVKLDSVDFL